MSTEIQTGLGVLRRLLALPISITGIIAGGAVRDSLLNKNVKDVDIFVSSFEYDASDLRDYIHDQLVKWGYIVEVYENEVTRLYDEGGGDTLRFEVDGVSIEVVPVEDIEVTYNKFPDSISRAYVNASGTTITSQVFNESIIDKRIRFREDLSNSRVAKLRGKFPDYEFIPVEMLLPIQQEHEELILE